MNSECLERKYTSTLIVVNLIYVHVRQIICLSEDDYWLKNSCYLCSVTFHSEVILTAYLF